MCTKAFIYKDTSQGAQDGCYHILYQQQLLPVHAETFFKIYFPRIFSFLTKVQKTEGAPSINPARLRWHYSQIFSKSIQIA